MCEDVHAVLFMAIKEHIDMHMQTYAAIIILRYVIDNNKSHNVSILIRNYTQAFFQTLRSSNLL